jgi:hypothetical protein
MVIQKKFGSKNQPTKKWLSSILGCFLATFGGFPKYAQCWKRHAKCIKVQQPFGKIPRKRPKTIEEWEQTEQTEQTATELGDIRDISSKHAENTCFWLVFWVNS